MFKVIIDVFGLICTIFVIAFYLLPLIHIFVFVVVFFFVVVVNFCLWFKIVV